MKSSKIAIILFVFIVFSLSFCFLFLANSSWLRIDGYELEGVSSYSIKSNIIKHIGSNYLFLNKGKLEKDIKSLGYVDSVSFKFRDNTLVCNIKARENGIIAYSDAIAFFFDGTDVSVMDHRDAYSLRENYLIVEVGKEYSIYMQKYGFDSDFVDVLRILYNTDVARTLITRAQFNDNKSNVTKSLTLDLEELSSTLIISDLSKLSALPDCLDYISSENESKLYDTIFSKSVYQLKSNGLVRIKR